MSFRSREEIQQDFMPVADQQGSVGWNDDVLLEVLLDIRDLLQNPPLNPEILWLLIKRRTETGGAVTEGGGANALAYDPPEKDELALHPCTDPELKGECSGCTDRYSEGTHQGCTKQHGHVGCALATGDDWKPEKDELFDAIVVAARQRPSKTLTCHFIIKAFNVPYARATRLIDALEAHGIISKKEGNKPRRVL